MNQSTKNLYFGDKNHPIDYLLGSNQNTNKSIFFQKFTLHIL